VDDGVQRREVDPRVVRREDGDHLLGRADAGQRGHVVRAVDRRAVVDVVGAGHEDRPDASTGEPPGCSATRSTDRGLHVGVEQVARDQEQVHLLGDREVHGGPERVELPLALCGGGFPEVRVPRAQVDVGGMQQSKHSVRPALPGRPSRDRARAGKPTGTRERPAPAPRSRDLVDRGPHRTGRSLPGPAAIRRPHRSRLATESLASL
jgi:hypothetical protein